MIGIFLVVLGVCLAIYLGSDKVPNNRWVNAIGSVVVAFAVGLFIYKYTYLGIGFHSDKEPPANQVPPTSETGQCDDPIR